jgi:hypothetical protein
LPPYAVGFIARVAFVIVEAFAMISGSIENESIHSLEPPKLIKNPYVLPTRHVFEGKPLRLAEVIGYEVCMMVPMLYVLLHVTV